MNKKPRSPRFPFIPLQAALRHARSLREEFGVENEVAPAKAIRAMGFDTMSGKANKVLAAMKAYGLITRERTQEAGMKVALTPLGAALAKAKAPRSPEHLEKLREAALSPAPFRNLWHRFPGRSEEDLVTTLEKRRRFTEQGAIRAARVYTANARFARLEDAAFRENNTVPLPPAQATPSDEMTVSGADIQPTRKLQIPLGDGNFAAIPVGISAQDFKLLMETLQLWKPKIVEAC